MFELITQAVDTTVVADTVKAVVDSAQADSLAKAVGGTVGTAIGAYLATKLVMILGAAQKGAFSLIKTVSAKVDGLSAPVKAVVGFVLAQGLVIANQHLAALGAPQLPADISLLAQGLVGTGVWLAGMGVHALIDVIKAHFTKTA